jgi:hypothetical protein
MSTVTFQCLLNTRADGVTLSEIIQPLVKRGPTMATETSARHATQLAAAHEPPALARAAGIIVGLTVVLALIFIAFALPAARSKPHDVPIGVAGPGASAAQIETQLGAHAPGGFLVTNYRDEGALRNAILDRDVYGGIALTAQGPTLLLATGASPAVAQALTQIGAAMAELSGRPLHTEDLAALPPDDPRGIGLAAAALPLTLAGLLPAVVLLVVFKTEVWLRFGATVVFAAVAALTVAALLRYLFGAIDQNFWGVTAGLFLGALAMGLSVLGLGSVFGKPGLAVGAALAILLGNPLSGLASAPELLPAGWGSLGQFLPQGANATLLRSTAYFSGAGAGTAIVVLTCWAVAGTALIAYAATNRNSGRSGDHA